MGMTKRDRVLAALRGAPVDRPPYAFWAHNYAKENSAADLTEETVRLLNEFGYDFLKPQTRAQAFEEAFGAVWTASGQRTVRPTPVSLPVQAPRDFAKITPADWTTGPLGEQIEALRSIRAAVGDVPVIWTIFNPLMIARRLSPGAVATLRQAMQEEPAALRTALDSITETMIGYARAAMANGADGLFYATNVATAGQLTEEEYRHWGVADDLKILGAVSEAPFNMLHLCGEAVYFDIFAGYPVHVFSYATSPQNPSLPELEARTGKAVAGGVTTKPADQQLTSEDFQREVRDAVALMAGRKFLVAPGCSNTPAMADIVAAAARDTLQQA